MSGQGQPIKRPNALRTKVDANITTTAAEISLLTDFLLNTEDIMSVSITPATADTILMAGNATDDFVNIGEGIVLNVDFKDKVSNLPFIKAASGTVTVNYLVAIIDSST